MQDDVTSLQRDFDLVRDECDSCPTAVEDLNPCPKKKNSPQTKNRPKNKNRLGLSTERVKNKNHLGHKQDKSGEH